MNQDLADVLGSVARNSPASEGLLQAVALELGIELPLDYAAFMATSNGAAGRIGHSHLNLYPLEILRKVNEAAKVDVFAPGLLIFGSDGGGTCYAFDARTPALSIVAVPDIGMSLDEAETIAETFEEFLWYLASS